MKRSTIILMTLSIALLSCKEIKKEHPIEVKITNESSDHKSDADVNLDLDNSWVNEMALNNGIKWSANTETTDGVREMLSLIKDNNTTTTDDYIKLGVTLNNVKNTVVKECTMEGASHDNLHIWLHPLIEKIELLQKVQNAEGGEQLTSNIKTHLEGYYDYFN
nr:hypothetical protein [uncultured bacterium]